MTAEFVEIHCCNPEGTLILHRYYILVNPRNTSFWGGGVVMHFTE